MSKNAAGKLTIVTPLSGVHDYSFAAADDVVALYAIPSGGTILRLPDDARSGDTYEFSDADGSCSMASQAVLLAAAGQAIHGSSSFPFTNAFDHCSVTYDESNKTWVIVSSPTGSGGGGGGITQLTGDVLAGPGSGSVSTQIVHITGNVAGAPPLVVLLGDGTNDLEFLPVGTAPGVSAPNLVISSFGAGSPPFLNAGEFILSTGTGADAVAADTTGGNGGTLQAFLGAGGASTGTAANSNGGDFVVTANAPGTGGSGAAGRWGEFQVNHGGQSSLVVDHDFVTIGNVAMPGGIFMPPLSSVGGVLQADTSTGLLGTTGYREDVIASGIGVSVPNGPGVVDTATLTPVAGSTLRIELFCSDLTPGETIGYNLASDTISAQFINNGGNFIAQIANRSGGGDRTVNYRVIQTSPPL